MRRNPHRALSFFALLAAGMLSAGAQIQPSDEATTLLKRAETALSHDDLKLAIDSLQRVTELEGSHLVAAGGGRYESARLHAIQRIAALPGNGLSVYRELYQAEAAALMQEAIRRHDHELLGRVIHRFILTDAGQQAAMTLASWQMDQGSFLEAAATLSEIQAVQQATATSDWSVLAMQIACELGQNRPDAAHHLLAKLRDSVAPPARISMIERAIEQRPAADQRPTWPTLGGGPSRSVSMPSVDPSFDSRSATTIELPRSKRLSSLLIDSQRDGYMPSRHVVCDGQRLITKGEKQLIALDADTLQQLWSSTAEDEWVQQAASGRTSPGRWRAHPASDVMNDPLANEELAIRMLFDQVGGRLTIAEGLILTVEWQGALPPPLALMRQSSQGRMRMRRTNRTSFADASNQLVAYSAETGLLEWRSEPLSDNASDADSATTSGMVFLDSGVVVDDTIVAPARIGNELFAILVDLQTGKITTRIYLCSISSNVNDDLHALTPCVDDGAVYLPTSQGLLFCLNTHNWQIRWVTEYEQAEDPLAETNWQRTTVASVSGKIILAPADADQLFCFDMTTGKQLWFRSNLESHYLIASGNATVFAVGERVFAIDVETGHQTWTVKAGEPSGLGALSGNTLFLPTVDGLQILDASSGAMLSPGHSGGAQPWGNLLAFDGALYSISATALTQLPDLKEGYQRALARHQADPTDPSAALRLAWLEQLRRQPANAMAVLQEIPEQLEQTDPTRYDLVIHLRVQAMIALALSGELSEDRILETLRKAHEIARSDADRIKTSIQIASFHRDHNQLIEACEVYRSLILPENGDEMISLRDGLHQRASVVANRQLNLLRSRLSDQQWETFTETTNAIADTAGQSSKSNVIERLAAASALGDIAARANVILAVNASRELSFERAESFYRRGLDCVASPELEARILVRLACLYLPTTDPSEGLAALHMPVSARSIMQRLESDFNADMQIPVAALQPPGLAEMGIENPDETITLGNALATLQSRIDPDILQDHARLLEPGPMSSPYNIDVRTGQGRPLAFRPTREEVTANLQIQLKDERELIALTAEKGHFRWSAELALLGEPAIPAAPSLSNTTLDNTSSTPLSPLARGVLAGQTLLMNSEFGLHAIGLPTGRRLWSHPHTPPSEPGAGTDSSRLSLSAGSDTWLWTEGDYLVSLNAGSQLEATSIADNGKILWRQEGVGKDWFAVRARSRYIVAADTALEKVDVFDLASGDQLGQCTFTQPEPINHRVSLMLFDEVICGPTTEHEVSAMDLRSSGQARWRVETPDALSQLFKPSPGLLAIADRSGRLQIVDPGTGRTRLETTVYPCQQGVVGGALYEGVLYLYGYQKRVTDRPDRSNQRLAIVAIRMNDGKILWQRSGLSGNIHLSNKVMAAPADVIPLVMTRSVKARNRNQQNELDISEMQAGDHLQFAFLSRKTGRIVSPEIKGLLPENAGLNPRMDVELLPNLVIVRIGTVMVRIELEKGGMLDHSVPEQGDISEVFGNLLPSQASTGQPPAAGNISDSALHIEQAAVSGGTHAD